jgi:hypothetical protein
MLPLVLGTAIYKHRLRPIALTVGFSVSIAATISFAALALSGIDRIIQASLVKLSPEWLINLSIYH